MESRCYHGGDNRTKMNALRYGKKDTVAFLIFAVFFGVILSMNLLGGIL
jgi:energy-coupling factor transport system permease protein